MVDRLTNYLIELPCSNQGATNENRVTSYRAKDSDPGFLNIKLVARPLSSFLLHTSYCDPINLRNQPSNGLVIYKGCGYAVFSVYA
jgi:hypothetical protein